MVVVYSQLIRSGLKAGEEGEELDKEMGELGMDNPEEIERNLWVPEEDQDETEVSVYHYL